MARLFFALDLPARVRRQLLRLQAPVPGARWQNDAQLHLTLLFLGRVTEQAVPEVCAAARDLPVARFDLEVRGLGCFGRPETPRNLWAGVQPTAPVVALNDALRQRLAPLGYELETRPFRPHITLARFRQRRGSVAPVLAEHDQDTFGPVSVDNFVLLESTQGPHGSVYTVVERFGLRNSVDEIEDAHQR
ncbi:RNA 2',3'-cyclic phosphodiesterase [Marinobacter sp.]|uniref:RNA 2',3'-cyclic phosphodiesterase n=1 Tax=Marinobacter sp. TaxID=50741 RepID=UPI0035C70E35